MNNSCLTEREYCVLKLLVEGKNNKEIAEDLSIEPCTVKAHVTSILKKFKVKNRLQAIIKVMKEKLI